MQIVPTQFCHGRSGVSWAGGCGQDAFVPCACVELRVDAVPGVLQGMLHSCVEDVGLSGAACHYLLTARPSFAVTWLGLMPGLWGSLWSFPWICVQLFSPCLYIYMLLSTSPGFPSVTSGLYPTTWIESSWSIPEASQLRLLSWLTCGASGTEFKLDLCLNSGLIFLLSFSGLLHWAHWCATDEAAA